MSQPTVTDTTHILDILGRRYGMSAHRLVRLPIGQGTVNFRATGEHREVFVKTYPFGVDIAGERGAIDLSELAGRHGVPVASIVRNREGETIDTSTGQAVSVWEWVPGEVVTKGFTPEQSHAAGWQLGRIHATYATLAASARASAQVDAWLAVDLTELSTTINRLSDIVQTRIDGGSADAFDHEAARTLAERRSSIGQIPRLLAELPNLTSQVLHGDYSPVNLLFDGPQLSAVVDFRPPDPFFIAYELGRLAFYPNTVVARTDWLDDAHTLIAAYVQANRGVAAHDIRACARVALLQLLTSLYGVKQHYLRPGLIQDDLDSFWLLRHQTVHILLDHQADTDAVLRDLA